MDALPTYLLTVVPLLIGLVAYIVRVEKCLTSIKKDICFIKKHCPKCHPEWKNPGGDHDDEEAP